MKKTVLAIVILLLLISLFFNVPNWFLSQEHRAEVTNEIDSIKLDTKGVDTTIISKNQDYVEAELKGKGNVSLSKKGNTIEIEYHRQWFSLLNFGRGTKLIVTIPEKYDRDLKLEVASGNIDFQLSDDTVLNSLEMEVGSGDINIGSLHTKSTSLDVASGDIDIKHFTGELDIEVASGNVSIQLDQLAGDIEAEVNSGRVALDLPKDSSFNIDGKTSSGTIKNHFPLKNEVAEKDRLRGTYGSGKYDIHLDVSSGTIEIK
ncbi:DUF4097 family beta strand repeat-containing protein [Ureibacillus sp. FSL K6-8385]|uniref:DUF4097 domain-containing protein n=1 Tax=Ureibacillus terrenus TaxID=118246 RepID=A0A540V6V1_9BACL|nr:DUF4097 family beta strand repeat-containing protein [Ureibacillus terrenus]MED3662159.1 DUF4097 family beta strand repeat-containing protein [Ureibacillus terrenus]MED3764427.1 DUF4097 family beta strand repeat-containing protein [Ureibacillus terrenus]TQE91903.1 DUF4097 domain-containing protein [Ureibacillus terrenus]